MHSWLQVIHMKTIYFAKYSVFSQKATGKDDAEEEEGKGDEHRMGSPAQLSRPAHFPPFARLSIHDRCLTVEQRHGSLYYDVDSLGGLSMCAFGHGHVARKRLGVEMADAFHGLSHFEFLEEHEEPSTAASKRGRCCAQTIPKTLAMQPMPLKETICSQLRRKFFY